MAANQLIPSLIIQQIVTLLNLAEYRLILADEAVLSDDIPRDFAG